jgi:hypothetical protein
VVEMGAYVHHAPAGVDVVPGRVGNDNLHFTNVRKGGRAALQPPSLRPLARWGCTSRWTGFGSGRL